MRWDDNHDYNWNKYYYHNNNNNNDNINNNQKITTITITTTTMTTTTIRTTTALAVKKNCSLVVQKLTWLAAVGTGLSQSSSSSGSRDTLTMFNLHFCLIFRGSVRAIWLAFLTTILSSLRSFPFFKWIFKWTFKSLTFPVSLGFFKTLLTLLWLQPTWSAVSVVSSFPSIFKADPWP